MTDLNLSGITSANELLRRLGAEQVLVLLQRLGFWVAGENPLTSQNRKVFPSDLSKLNSAQLGDQCSYWQSELSRLIAIIGAIQSQKVVSEFELKRARNTALASLLKQYRAGDEKPPSQTGLAAEVSTRPEVQTAEEALLGLDVSITALGAIKEALEGYARVLSREISRRGDLLRSGVER